MISIALLHSGRADYYIERQAGCELEYYTGAGERPGVWCGTGAEALGLTGELNPAGEHALRAALDGEHPEGGRLVRAVPRPDPVGRLPVRPLLAALVKAADRAGLTGRELYADPAGRAELESLLTRVERDGRGQTATVPVEVAGRLAAGAGMDPHEIYRTHNGRDRYASALRHAGDKVDARLAGLDITFSAPKSVSILYALGDRQTADAVRESHRVAVGEALGYLQRVAGHGLRGHQGGTERARRVGTDGFIGCGFEHRTSRADDPQLHTHLVVANLLHGEDGRWSAIDTRAVHRHAKTAGFVYQAVLRGELTARLGVGWTAVDKGVGQIRWLPHWLCEEFSTRRRDIEAELARTGSSGRKAAQKACYATRPAKSHAGELMLRDRWAARTRELGADPGVLVAAALAAGHQPELADLLALTRSLCGPDGLTRRQTTFTRAELIQRLCVGLPVGSPVTADQLDRLADRILTDQQIVPLAPAGPHGRAYTTAELLLTEQRALRLADRSAGPVAGLGSHAGLGGFGLSAEQRAAVAALLGSARMVELLTGPAGSGKTATLSAARAAWTPAGLPVVGAALAAVAARRLEQATGIHADTLHRLLGDADRIDPATGAPAGLAPRSVVVIDEASLVGTRQLARLFTHVATADGRCVLVGDPAQLAEVEAGGLFAALTGPRATIGLAGNQRQSAAWERRALAQLRAGRVGPAIQAYLQHGRIHPTVTLDQSRDEITRAYLQHLQTASNPLDVVMVTATRSDTAALNQCARVLLHEVGMLDHQQLTLTPELDLAAGDLVLVTRNDRRRGLLNGTRAQVVAVEPGSLTLRTDSGHPATVPAGWAAHHLDHAYAMTCHKAQGLTVRVALLHGTTALCQQSGYVGLSRGRTENHVYASVGGLRWTPDAADGPNPPSQTVDPQQVVAALREQLGITRAHSLATSQALGQGRDRASHASPVRDFDHRLSR